jgi:hypothetical protein
MLPYIIEGIHFYLINYKDKWQNNSPEKFKRKTPGEALIFGRHDLAPFYF